jgi:hypothetical protein
MRDLSRQHDRVKTIQIISHTMDGH